LIHIANKTLAGNTYSIKNVGSGTARVFFAQARETFAGEE
jgi:centromere protein C